MNLLRYNLGVPSSMISADNTPEGVMIFIFRV